MKKIKKVAPFSITLLIVLIDQLSKAWVVKNVPLNTVYREFFGDFIWIVHVRNTGAAFSMGAGSSVFFRLLFLVIGCIAMMVGLGFMVVNNKQNTLTEVQRWFCAGIMGGGIGTIIDRIFRFNTGVVDFISVNMYGFLGMDRFATFNISDSCVVCFVIAFVISEIVNTVKQKKRGGK